MYDGSRAQDALAQKPPVLVPGTVIYKLDPSATNWKPVGAAATGPGLVPKSVLGGYDSASTASGALYGSYLALAVADPVQCRVLQRELRPLLDPASMQVADLDITLVPALSGCHVHANHTLSKAPAISSLIVAGLVQFVLGQRCSHHAACLPMRLPAQGALLHGNMVALNSASKSALKSSPAFFGSCKCHSRISLANVNSQNMEVV